MDDVIYLTEEEKLNAICDAYCRAARQGTARPGRHHLHREIREAFPHAHRQRRPPRGPQREEPCPGGAHHRGCRRQGLGDHRHQHGRPRDRHQARAATPSSVRARRPARRRRRMSSARRSPRSTRSGRRTTRRSRALDGLHVLGTERHEARRIDNQLRGRSGRQGDPGLLAVLHLPGG